MSDLALESVDVVSWPTLEIEQRLTICLTNAGCTRRV